MDNNNDNTTVWAGVKDSNIGFARQQNTLNGQGYANLTSFNAENVSGISFLDDSNDTSASASAPQQQG